MPLFVNEFAHAFAFDFASQISFGLVVVVPAY